LSHHLLPPSAKLSREQLWNYYNYTAISDSWMGLLQKDMVTERILLRNTSKLFSLFLSTVKKDQKIIWKII
jgi:hypothetical protein